MLISQKLRVISQLRISSKNLIRIRSKIGSHVIDTNQTCQIYNCNLNETLIHILFKCPLYLTLRNQYLSAILESTIVNSTKLNQLLIPQSVTQLNNLYFYVIEALKALKH
ncbi:hypothetical protein O3M35_004872 [Rhynocoris fuscipes]|uniref:Reverse transcriptase zinc-binding domain-containing protein n=1 Tax=Rhynocoris fuscipes TaxID=488301 RepID=A0AAW1DIE9_9HEMI